MYCNAMDMRRCGMDMEWSGVVWCGVVWCGVVWCGYGVYLRRLSQLKIAVLGVNATHAPRLHTSTRNQAHKQAQVSKVLSVR